MTAGCRIPHRPTRTQNHQHQQIAAPVSPERHTRDSTSAADMCQGPLPGQVEAVAEPVSPREWQLPSSGSYHCGNKWVTWKRSRPERSRQARWHGCTGFRRMNSTSTCHVLVPSLRICRPFLRGQHGAGQLRAYRSHGPAGADPQRSRPLVRQRRIGGFPLVHGRRVGGFASCPTIVGTAWFPETHAGTGHPVATRPACWSG
jgi:hypothetical protein